MWQWDPSEWQDCGDDQAQDAEPQIWSEEDEHQQQQLDSEEPETAQVQSLGSYSEFLSSEVIKDPAWIFEVALAEGPNLELDQDFVDNSIYE